MNWRSRFLSLWELPILPLLPLPLIIVAMCVIRFNPFESVGAGEELRANQITLALTGDSIITQRVSVYDENKFLALIKTIRQADAAFTNFEMVIRDEQCYPAPAQCPNVYMVAKPFVIDELKWMGFDLLSRANNHAMDYGGRALMKTSTLLRETGLVYAGVGRNLAEAREPSYLETQKGRIALISASATFPQWARAGEARRDMLGRPGLNPVRFGHIYFVDKESMNHLRKIKASLGLSSSVKTSSKNTFIFLNQKFVVGSEPQILTRINESDMRGIMKSIEDAKRQTDWIIVSLHVHQGDGSKIEKPAKFVVRFARCCIDRGADVFVSHGPHILRGIEIYKGKPIFYSLGNFIFQNETVEPLPADIYELYGLGNDASPMDLFDLRSMYGTIGYPAEPKFWESVVAQVTLQNHMLYELKLYPISLGYGKRRSQRGRPVLTSENLGRKIINRLRDLSLPYETNIVYEKGVGVVRLGR